VGVQVKREGAYLDGQLHGKVTHYTERGAVEKVETWERGVLKSSGGR
jgi:antitoxin component YwqK of YwqJK toxin-antitoxin module